MSVRHILCGPYANESEKHAALYMEARLRNTPSEDLWVLLTNVSHTSGSERLADEIDQVIVGPTGIFVVEVKHWDAGRLSGPLRNLAESTANVTNAKAKRIRGKLDEHCAFSIPFVSPRYLFTRDQRSRYVPHSQRIFVNGVGVYVLAEWRDLVDLDGAKTLLRHQVEAIVLSLEPAIKPQLNGDIRSFGDTVDLERQSPVEDAFHRVYRGKHRRFQDRVVLHLYDLSASHEKNPEEMARREFMVRQRLQKAAWLPSLMDSFQDAPGYPGELCFFCHADTEAASIERRRTDPTWTVMRRVSFALSAADALLELHRSTGDDGADANLHRNLSPRTIRVRADNQALLTGLQFARLCDQGTISEGLRAQESEDWAAPEVRQGGLAACTTASDVYSLCTSLLILFDQNSISYSPGLGAEALAEVVRSVLRTGVACDRLSRPDLQSLQQQLKQTDEECHMTRAKHAVPDASGGSTQPPRACVPLAYWDESTTVPFRERQYRIVARLGSGSVGTTFKVMETGPDGQEKSGPYVAKAITHSTAGPPAIEAYARVRAQTGAPGLAGVLEVAPQWRDDEISALLRWVDGEPLSNLIGVLPLHFEDYGQPKVEDGALAWARDLCQGLATLHSAGLVHGDVSPKNVIVNGLTVVLTDYDLSGRVGAIPFAGTPDYCSDGVDRHEPIGPSDDVFALAATLFHAVFERKPFRFPTGLDKSHGLFWDGIDSDGFPRLKAFLDRATNPNQSQRFAAAMDALQYFSHGEPGGANTPAEDGPLEEHIVLWLSDLLQSYPGSPKGNTETRGLDTEFAQRTYVETGLEEPLARDIRAGKVRLVILCGNAGDGKTAFLQALAHKLGHDPGQSSQRIWDFCLDDGRRIYANLDGSAAWNGRPAPELLDDLFLPFVNHTLPENETRLLAINDGPLKEWLQQQDESEFTQELEGLLAREQTSEDSEGVYFIDLNTRSLVGGLSAGGIYTKFFDQLVDKLLGPEGTWECCPKCSANGRCHAWASVKALSAPAGGALLRARLARALQAVHHRGEAHITARSLRSALVFIFFGVHDCRDLHEQPEFTPPLYWDRAFAPSPIRQGELLAELQRLDPGLDSHPLIDRYLLLDEDAAALPGLDGATMLRSLRRQAYFMWDIDKICRIGSDESALDIAGARHLAEFQRVATGSDEERQSICEALCEGLALMDNLPEEAVLGHGYPFRITPRTPTETAFWVNKPRNRFSLRAVIPETIPGLDALHTHVELTYHFDDGRNDRLRIAASLFHLLLDVREGYQVTSMQSDDLFAQLSIFKQRLAQEGDRTLYAWNPLGQKVFRVDARHGHGTQNLVMEGIGEAL